MLRVAFVTAVFVAGIVSVAHADSFRPGASSAGGRIAKFCNTDYLSPAEQKDCFRRFKKAKTEEELRELVGTLQETMKARQEEVDKQYERLNPGGRSGPVCTGQECQ